MANETGFAPGGHAHRPATRALIFPCCGSIHDVSCPTCEPSVDWVKPLCRRLDNLEIELAQANAAQALAEAELEAERLKFAKARQKSWALATLVSAAPSRDVCAQLAASLGLTTLAEMLKEDSHV